MYKHVPKLTGGMNVFLPPDSIKEEESPYIENLVFDEGVLKVESGYKTWGGVVRGYPQKVFQLFKKAGTSVLLLITTSTLYKWASDEWQYVSDSNESTVSGAHATGATTLVVASTTSFSVSDVNANSAYIGIILSDGNQHQTKVSAVSGPHWITMDTAFSSSVTAGHGAAVVESVPLEGDLGDPVSCAVWVPDDDLVFTNNKDNVKLYDSSADECKNVQNLPGSGDCLARVVRVFKNYVVLFSTTEGGTDYPQRVRRCDTGDPTDWTNGNAGYNDLWDREDAIAAAEQLGPNMAVYREKSIWRMTFIGSASKLFEFSEMVTGQGVPGPEAVATMEDAHFIFGNSGIYRYVGGYALNEVGKELRPYIFGKGGTLNPGYSDRVIASSVREMKEVWFMVPQGSETELGLLLKYNRDTDGWTLRTLTHDLCGYGKYQATTGRAWSELVGSWSAQDWYWNETRMLSGAPEMMLCGYNPLQVYEYDYFTIGDNATEIDWEFQTKDFYNPHAYYRMNLLEFYAKGSSVIVSYSEDRGSTWTALETKTLTTPWARYRVWHQKVARQIRYKFNGSSGGFGLEWLGLDFEEESNW